MSLGVGARLGHYSVTAKLGQGGMGEVWRATDTQLNRDVALKILPEAFATDPDRLARFQREARVLASLNHPGIAAIYGIEEEAGTRALVLELVEGPTLAERISKGPIPIDEALQIAKQLAEALEAAHEAGVIHRDLKPANIKVRDDGTVKVLDFGLAKAPAAAGAGDLNQSPTLTAAATQMGVIMGTAAYMSPEQARGVPVDRRADIWSFGVVLYEMISARSPFTGDSTITLLSSILKDDARPVENLPEGLSTVLRRCLAKDPAERFQTVEELSEALAATIGPTVAGGRSAAPADVPRLVVRPFKSRVGDEELRSFAEGLAEDIIGGMALFSHLSVSAESAEPRRDARFAVEGALRKSGSRVRANIRLLDCESGAHLWAEQFDRDLETEDVFAAQDALTDRIVATLADPSGVLTHSLVAWVKKKPSSHLSAHECVLRTFGYFQQWRQDEHAALRRALEQAVAREPDHVDAGACLSLLYLDEYRYHFNPRPDALARALGEAQRAVELDATSQLANRALAETQYFRRELGVFRSATERVLMLNPRDTSSIGMVALLTAFSGDWERGKSIMTRVMAMNPHHAGWVHFVSCFDHYRQREYGKALEAAEQINMPWYPWSYGCVTICHAQLGHAEAATKHLNDFLALSPRYAKIARRDLAKWFVSAEHVEHTLEGFAKAGLDVEGAR